MGTELLANFYTYVLPLLITLASTFVVYLLRGLINKYQNKLGAQTAGDLQNILSTSALRGVYYAEQMAKRLEQEQRMKMANPTKLTLAVEFVMGELERLNIKGVMTKEIERLVESMLGMDNANNDLPNGLFPFPPPNLNDDADEDPDGGAFNQ